MLASIEMLTKLADKFQAEKKDAWKAKKLREKKWKWNSFAQKIFKRFNWQKPEVKSTPDTIETGEGGPQFFQGLKA